MSKPRVSQIVLLLVLASTLVLSQPPKSRVEVLLPIDVVSVDTISLISIQNGSVLQFSARAAAGQQIEFADLELIFVRPDGSIRYGEGWRQQLGLEARTRTYTADLRGQREAGERVLLVFRTIAGSSTTWRIPDKEKAAKVMEYLRTGSFSPSLEVSPRGPVANSGRLLGARLVLASHDPGYCDSSHQTALSQCQAGGSAGLNSFSCNGDTHSYSYECMPILD
jgi:hypothetical protein